VTTMSDKTPLSNPVPQTGAHQQRNDVSANPSMVADTGIQPERAEQ